MVTAYAGDVNFPVPNQLCGTFATAASPPAFTLSSGFFSSSPLDSDVSINAELLVLTSIAANNFRPLAQARFLQHLLSASLPVLEVLEA